MSFRSKTANSTSVVPTLNQPGTI